MTNSTSSCALQTIPIDSPLANAKWMTARVYSLMFHFWRDDMPVEVRAMVIADWRAALGDIPKAAIEMAIAERVRDDDRRKPIPGEIRQRAKKFLQSVPVQADNATFPPIVTDPKELERRREMQAKLRREFPMLKQMEGD